MGPTLREVPASACLPVLHALRLAAFAGRATDPWTGDVDTFVDDVAQHRSDVDAAIARGLVQFTEPLRLTDLLPGIAWAARRYQGRPLRLVEIGACAGLLLVPEAYRIRYPRVTWPGDPAGGPLSELVSDLDVPPDLLGEPLDIVDRVGIDLAPVDPSAPESLDYLRSFAWSDDVRREERLAGALAAVAVRPPTLLAGDATELLPEVLAATRDVVTVVVESATAHYLPSRSHRRMGLVLDAAAAQGPVVTVTRSPAPAAAPQPDWQPTSSVAIVDLTARWRCTYAVTDMISERQAWVAGAALARG